MKVTEEPLTTVIDAGGRYGLHPTWKRFTGKLSYHLFEPDPDESARLARKYAARGDSIQVHPVALGENRNPVRLNILQHRGQNSVLKPRKESFWFAEARPDDGKVVAVHEAPCETLDHLRAEKGINPDFLKLDTEGSELPILRGAAGCLRDTVIGLRSEAHFDAVYEGLPLFPELHRHLFEQGFMLLNLDYTGTGVAWSEFTMPDKFGVLMGCDSVWIKRPDILFGDGVAPDVAAVRSMKLAAFCFANNATDVAVRILIDGTRKRGMRLADYADTALGRYLDVTVQMLFNRLRALPSIKASHLDGTYRELFAREPKLMHHFFESDEINPG